VVSAKVVSANFGAFLALKCLARHDFSKPFSEGLTGNEQKILKPKIMCQMSPFMLGNDLKKVGIEQ